MATATRTTNRRALLGAIGLAPVALVAAVPVQAICAPAIDRRAWDQAFAAHERARAACEAYQPTYEAAVQGFERDRPNGDGIDLRPIMSIAHRRYDMLHREDLDALHSTYCNGLGKWWFSPNPEAQIEKHKATCDQVRQFRSEFQAAKDRHNYEAVTDQDEALSQAAYDARWALLETPAPDLAALRFKLEYLFADGAAEDGNGAEPWAQHVMANLMADVGRLMPKEA